jgi:type VI secretion system VasD/TssJ family lipoprotein
MTPFRGKAIIPILTACGLITLLVGCSSVPKNILQEPPAEPEAIVLNIKADSMLNQYNSEPHTLVLCVYQLSVPDVFKDMVKNDEGLSRLMSCASFGDSVTTSQRIIVNPGEVTAVVVDREKGTLFVGLVGGYYDPTPGKSYKLYKIPITVYREGFAGWKEMYRWPDKLRVSLILNPKGIREEQEK